jgi:uncharacterized alpha-E superfamily protein
MLSRVAETIYGIGRYQERAGNTARLVTVNTNLMLVLSPQVVLGWDALISLIGGHEAYGERHPEFTEQRAALLVDEVLLEQPIRQWKRADDSGLPVLHPFGAS